MWTYSGTPSTTPLDETRFWIQDTTMSFQMLQDEELQWLLDTYLPTYGSPIAIAAIACEVLAAKFTRQVNTSADGVSVSLGDLQQRYNDLAASLRSQYAELGGSNLSDSLNQMFSDISQFEIEPLVFGVGFMDNYKAGQQDYGYYAPGETNWVSEATGAGGGGGGVTPDAVRVGGVFVQSEVPVVPSGVDLIWVDPE
jgi:hypothetical protein